MRVLIVGAGFGGIGAAIELQRHGFDDITILDHAAELGGTWRDNSYPGAACDVPSHLYSFSFAQRRDWSRLCSPQQEILDYLRRRGGCFGVDRLVVPDTRVVACDWDDDSHAWRTAGEDGRDVGVRRDRHRHRPAAPARYPAHRGDRSLRGTQLPLGPVGSRLRHGGKRVAVIGTGASAVQ